MFNLQDIPFVLGSTSGTWDLRTFLTNSFDTLGEWFSLAIMILGLVAVAFAAWQIVTGLMSQGRKQTNWGLSIGLLLVGGALSATTGFEFIQGIAGGGRKTIEDLGGNAGTILLYVDSLKSFLPK